MDINDSEYSTLHLNWQDVDTSRLWCLHQNSYLYKKDALKNIIMNKNGVLKVYLTELK